MPLSHSVSQTIYVASSCHHMITGSGLSWWQQQQLQATCQKRWNIKLHANSKPILLHLLSTA